MCLLGVDYFSTLAYQPSITFSAAGRLGPLATGVIVLVTLFGALPVYFYVAGRSPGGAGSIAVLERLVRGWAGKTLVLFLLGFAATDFVMIKALSLADAAEHLTHNPYLEQQKVLRNTAETLQDWMHEHVSENANARMSEQLLVTVVLSVVGFWFWWILRRGFDRNVLVWAVPVVLAYLVLNAFVIGAGLVFLWNHPERIDHWWGQVQSGDWHMHAPFWAGPNWFSIGLLCLLLLPQLSLGLSGFELSLILMPQIRGWADDTPEKPRGRIRNTRKVLFAAALIMSAYLLGAIFVTSLLIPESAFADHGPATNRALAYLAHGGTITAGPDGTLPELSPLFGVGFGSVYDLVTILLLTLAGTSVMTALSALLPQFLPRFGMELKWTSRWGVMLILFAFINLAVTLYFRANVEDQRGAYATGVLVLMSSASIVSAMVRREERLARGNHRFPWYFTLTAGVFTATAIAVIVMAPTGLLIAFGFIAAVLTMSIVIRAVRSDELRTVGYEFATPEANLLWNALKVQNLHINVFEENHRSVIEVTRCVSVAHAIAAIALEMSRESKPPSLHFGWTELDLLAASWGYFAFGEGNVPSKVRELIHAAEPDPAKRPRVIVG
jgi:hypothetical protein